MALRPVLALTLLLELMAPAAARADGLLIPFVGANFGGNSGKELSDAIDAKRFDWGVSLAYMGGGVFGIEGDIARSPDFYGKTDVGGSSVLTATGNLLLGIPLGGQKGFGFRPVRAGRPRRDPIQGGRPRRRPEPGQQRSRVGLRRWRDALLRYSRRPAW